MDSFQDRFNWITSSRLFCRSGWYQHAIGDIECFAFGDRCHFILEARAKGERILYPLFDSEWQFDWLFCSA